MPPLVERHRPLRGGSRILARARCGFGTYFLPNHYEDHWAAEHWNPEQGRWIFVDAQLDAFRRQVLGIAFGPPDVPRDQFVVAGQAWRMCRDGQADADRFGIFDLHGLAFSRGNLLRDVAALNKVELLPWDCWGLMLAAETDHPDDLALLDHLAALTWGPTPDTAAVRHLDETETRVKPGPRIQSYVDGSRCGSRCSRNPAPGPGAMTGAANADAGMDKPDRRGAEQKQAPRRTGRLQGRRRPLARDGRPGPPCRAVRRRRSGGSAPGCWGRRRRAVGAQS
jgi:hypothetical protein